MKVGIWLWFTFLCLVTTAVFPTEPSLICECSTIKDLRVQDIPVQRTNYSISSPNLMSAPLILDPCSFRMVGKQRISWNITLPKDFVQSSGDAVVLCVTIHELHSKTTSSNCFSLSMAGIQTFNKIDCLVDVSNMTRHYIMNAYIHMNIQGVERHLYGELRTAGIDFRKTCKYLCETDKPDLSSTNTCLHAWNVSIGNTSQVTTVVLRGLNLSTSLDASYTIQTTRFLTFAIPNVTSGSYHLEVLTYHALSGIVCNFTKLVYISCGDPEEVTSLGAPFEEFLIFASIVSLTMLALVISFVLGGYRLKMLGVCKKRPSIEEEAKPFKAKRKLSFLHNPFRHNHHHLPPVNQHFVDIINDINEFGPVPGQHMGIELTERPTFLLVPIPYDSFTIQIMNCLRPILTQEGRFTSQCIFDDCVYISDEQKRFRWVESVVNDKNQIIVFLCFTSPSSTRRERTLADELLDQFLRTRIKPLCSTFLVLVTDEDRSHVLGKTYHGSIIHLMQQNEYERFLREVFKLCGLTFNQDSGNRLQSIIRSRESVHFLTLIGHEDHS